MPQATNNYYSATWDAKYQPEYCALLEDKFCALTYETNPTKDIQEAVCTLVKSAWQPPAETFLAQIAQAVQSRFPETAPFEPDLFWIKSTVGYGRYAAFWSEPGAFPDVEEAAKVVQDELTTLGFVVDAGSIERQRTHDNKDAMNLTMLLNSAQPNVTCRAYLQSWWIGEYETCSGDSCYRYLATLSCAEYME